MRTELNGFAPSRAKFFSGYFSSTASKCVILVFLILMLRVDILSVLPSSNWSQRTQFYPTPRSSSFLPAFSVRQEKFLEVPQIVWGLNNQKIAFARACLTARLLNRTLLMPSLSASLFYKETSLLEPIAFDKVFKIDEFNNQCNGFVRVARLSEISNQTEPFELQKGRGRKWTLERDLNQLKQCSKNPVDEHEVLRIVGNNPFLWHDHWPIKDYAKIFECLVFVDQITTEASNVITMIRDKSISVGTKPANQSNHSAPYIAVHMRIEKDWVIHCKNLEQRLNTNQICSSREEIMERVGRIRGFNYPIVVYLAVADSLLEDGSILNGWKEGLLPFEKKKLGVSDIYKKYPYLIKSAIDYEVCARADVFVGNTYSTFSSLIVLERTLKQLKLDLAHPCETDTEFTSYAYNIAGQLGGPQVWMTNMSDSSLKAISYGTNQISCHNYK